MHIPDKDNPLVKVDPKSKAVFAKTVAKALRTDNRTLLPKVADNAGHGNWSFRDDPPVLRRISAVSKAKVIDALNRYALTLSPERRLMLNRLSRRRCRSSGGGSWFGRDKGIPGTAIRGGR